MGKQQGFTMVFTLIVLLIMMLAAISLTRSVDTAGVIMGNLAFTQSAIRSTDCGVETVITWLEGKGNSNLYNSDIPNGYIAKRGEGPDAASWANLPGVTSQVATTSCNPFTYIIQRLCDVDGNPSATPSATIAPPICSVPPVSSQEGTSFGGGGGKIFQASNQIYYRITVRVDGTRGTVSYVQVIIAM